MPKLAQMLVGKVPRQERGEQELAIVLGDKTDGRGKEQGDILLF